MNLKEALNIIDSGQVFKLKCVSYDKSRKKGGSIKEYFELMITKTKGDRQGKKGSDTPRKNHYENSTRTCFQCINGVPTSSLITFNIVLMLEVNNEKVML